MDKKDILDVTNEAIKNPKCWFRGFADAVEIGIECGVRIAFPRLPELLVGGGADNPCVYKHMAVRHIWEFPQMYQQYI
ncbi:MAG: hypothetical protein K2O54_01510, partial [Prevotella sp.]|nr:hypothetical protein [Prevotella sp.]